MATLSKVFANLVAVSQGDVETLSRATEEFVRDVTAQTNRMPRDSATPPAPPSPPTPQAGPPE
jgi:hypothetical protein